MLSAFSALSCSDCLLMAASHTRAVPSPEPVTMRAPSGATAMLVTVLVWPLRVASLAPVLASHTRAVVVREPVTMRAPSGLTATLDTVLV